MKQSSPCLYGIGVRVREGVRVGVKVRVGLGVSVGGLDVGVIDGDCTRGVKVDCTFSFAETVQRKPLP